MYTLERTHAVHTHTLTLSLHVYVFLPAEPVLDVTKNIRKQVDIGDSRWNSVMLKAFHVW